MTKKNDSKNTNQENENKKEANISQSQLNELMQTVGKMRETMENQSKIIDDQAEKINQLESKSDSPRRKKKREKVKRIKDEDREANLFVLNIELTEKGEFVYFDEDRQRLVDEKKVKRELLIMSIERSYTILKGKDETYLIGEFNCIDKDDKQFKVDIPYKALGECTNMIKAKMFKHYVKHDVETNEGTVTKYLRDEDGNIVDEYDIDLINTTSKYWFDLRVITEGNFKDKVFKKVPEENINLL